MQVHFSLNLWSLWNQWNSLCYLVYFEHKARCGCGVLESPVLVDVQSMIYSALPGLLWAQCMLRLWRTWEPSTCLCTDPLLPYWPSLSRPRSGPEIYIMIYWSKFSHNGHWQRLFCSIVKSFQERFHSNALLPLKHDYHTDRHKHRQMLDNAQATSRFHWQQMQSLAYHSKWLLFCLSKHYKIKRKWDIRGWLNNRQCLPLDQHQNFSFLPDELPLTLIKLR